MNDLKINTGCKVICTNETIAQENTNVVGRVEALIPSCFHSEYIAIVKYPGCKIKIPVEELKPCELDLDQVEIKITRKKFNDVINKHLKLVSRLALQSQLKEIENELFGELD